MNYLSPLLFRPCLCFIIYLLKHKVYSVYKYTAGLVGMERHRGKRCSGCKLSHAHTHTHAYTTELSRNSNWWAVKLNGLAGVDSE